jgi:hypothetical protein
VVDQQNEENYACIKQANPSCVGSEARDIILELGGQVRAHIVVKSVVGAAATETGVGADVDVAVNEGGVGGWTLQTVNTQKYAAEKIIDSR